MPTVLDLLNEPEFADNRLTEAINIPPYVTGRLGQLGLFMPRPLATTYAKLGVREQTITIIPSRERGGPSNKNIGRGHHEVLIPIPHFPLDDAITPGDLQNVLAYGEQNVFQTLASVYNDKILDMRAKHDSTLAHMEWAAINGIISDAENRTLLDTYEEFGLAKETIDYELDTEATDVAAKNRALKASIRKDLQGAPMSGIRIFASPDFYESYVGHANVAEAYRYYASSANPARDDVSESFFHAGVWLERIDEEFNVRLDDGTFESRLAIPEGEAISVPMGTPYFRRFQAPPDTIFDANQAPDIASRVFVSTDELPHGKGRDIHTESNTLPICVRPQTMKRLTI